MDDRSPLLALTDMFMIMIMIIMTEVGRSLLDTVVEDQVKPCRPANKACTVSVMELAAGEVDHTAHD